MNSLSFVLRPAMCKYLLIETHNKSLLRTIQKKNCPPDICKSVLSAITCAGVEDEPCWAGDHVKHSVNTIVESITASFVRKVSI